MLDIFYNNYTRTSANFLNHQANIPLFTNVRCLLQQIQERFDNAILGLRHESIEFRNRLVQRRSSQKLHNRIGEASPLSRSSRVDK